MSLKSSIRTTERSIELRHARLSVALDGATHSVGKRAVSPGTLVAAGLLFGVALHQYQRMHGSRMLELFGTANSGLQLLATLATQARAAAGR